MSVEMHGSFLFSASTERSSAQSSIYKSPQNSSAPQSWPLTSGPRPTVFLSVPKEMKASIVSYRNRFNKYLQDTSTHEEGTFDPWGLVNRYVYVTACQFFKHFDWFLLVVYWTPDV